jgi:hypothetical protein
MFGGLNLQLFLYVCLGNQVLWGEREYLRKKKSKKPSFYSYKKTARIIG